MRLRPLFCVFFGHDEDPAPRIQDWAGRPGCVRVTLVCRRCKEVMFQADYAPRTSWCGEEG